MSDELLRMTDVLGSVVIIKTAVWRVIEEKHPEVAGCLSLISEVLGQPEEVRYSVRRQDSALYYRRYADLYDGKWFVVVVKRSIENVVSTCYVTDRIKSGELLWKP
jgi:hypothetical protein